MFKILNLNFMYYLHKKVKKGIEPLLSVLQTNALPLCYLTFDQPNLLIYQSWANLYKTLSFPL